MTGIVDYNAGNITSVEHALEAIKAPYILSKDPRELEKVDRLIFPGVGDAQYAMEQLKKTGFDSFLKDWTQSGKQLIGICLGSQIIFDWSEEGDTPCLGLLKGRIRHFNSLWNERAPSAEERENAGYSMLEGKMKIPNMGWEDISFCNGGSRLLEGIHPETDFYFVHSYVIQPEDPSIIKAYSNYGCLVPAVVEKNNITAFQFHPEKSGEPGLQILRNYVKGDLA